jgi:hypothetical protein
VQIKYDYSFQMIFGHHKIYSLNSAYGQIIRRSGKHVYAQRYLLPDAKDYKERWLRLFQLADLPTPTIRKFHDLKEAEKPLIVLRLDWVYNTKEWSFSTGKLKGCDLSNAPKLIEDTWCEYSGIDDSRTVYLVTSKRPSEVYVTQCLMSVGYVDSIEQAENDPDFMAKSEPILRRGAMPDVYKAQLPCLVPYSALPNERKNKVDKLILAHTDAASVYEALRVGLQEFGTDVSMILTMVGMLTKRGQLKEGLWEKLVDSMENTGEDTVVDHPSPRAKTPRAKPTDGMRGKLPFSKLPKARETAEKFMEKWIKKNTKRKQYPKDMLNWETGSIRWDSPAVYGFSANDVGFTLYRALVEGRKNYSQLTEVCQTKGFSKDVMDATLKAIITEPKMLPPGAGQYCEDEATGDMWIQRDTVQALQQSILYRE